MNAPATAANQSPLEAALHEVHATLSELLVAADEQYAAVAAHDRDWIERVTRHQERLAARLARAERQRIAALGGQTLAEAIAASPAQESERLESLRKGINAAVIELKTRQSTTAGLLEKSIELSRRTLEFLQRLVTSPAPVYGARGHISSQRSALVDSRA